jgi:hypothetical protein
MTRHFCEHPLQTGDLSRLVLSDYISFHSSGLLKGPVPSRTLTRTERRCNMHLSTHYYVLSLGVNTNTLFEAFRDFLITVENRGFPVKTPAPPSNPVNTINRNRLRDLARTVDRCFGHYYTNDPLHLVVVGDKEMQSAFSTVTAHGTAVIGCIEGDHTATPAHELGKIVWPMVKEAMSGVLERALHDLVYYAGKGQMVSGLESVARLANKGVRATLLVENDYHMRGRVGGANESPVISTDVDVREAIDDAVDAVIEKILESGGNVVFTPPRSLRDWNRIVLLLHSAEKV